MSPKRNRIGRRKLGAVDPFLVSFPLLVVLELPSVNEFQLVTFLVGTYLRLSSPFELLSPLGAIIGLRRVLRSLASLTVEDIFGTRISKTKHSLALNSQVNSDSKHYLVY